MIKRGTKQKVPSKIVARLLGEIMMLNVICITKNKDAHKYKIGSGCFFKAVNRNKAKSAMQNERQVI